MGKYRYDIGISKYPYGNELEFVNASLQQLIEKFQHTSIPIEFIKDHKSSSTIYDKNYLDTDGTVSYQQDTEIYGGEISSRIYHNKKIDWIEIEEICYILLENGAEINELCSNHISVDLSPIKNENLFFETLAKAIIKYERQMDLFYMGDCYLERSTKDTYARKMSTRLLSKLNSPLFNKSGDYLTKLLYYCGNETFTRRDGISLKDYRYNKRMEIRYPNGTLTPKTIQNNSNFSLKLVDAIDCEKFDLDMLTQEVEELYKNKYWIDTLTEQEHYKQFEQITTVIATSSEDQDDFMTQYEKVLSTKHKAR